MFLNLAKIILPLTACVQLAMATSAPICSGTKVEIKSEKILNLPLFNNASTEMAYAQRLFTILTGSTIPDKHPHFVKVLRLLAEKKHLEAANLIVKEKNFLNVRMKNFVAPFSSKDGSPHEALNDLQALILGVTRDELDARLILTGDIRYSGQNSLSLPEVSLSNNDHYLTFENQHYSFHDDLELVQDQWKELDVAAGALTSRAWSKINYDTGDTNRLGVTNAFNVFLCAPIDSWKMRAVPDMFVRRDVPRAAGNEGSEYQNRCRNCHGFMDAMGGAFAKIDFKDLTLVYQKKGVQPKMNQNGHIYPAGFVTVDDSWYNLLNFNPSADFGWRTPLEGVGIKAFGEMLANSSAYSRCLVTKVFKEVCGKVIKDTAPELLEPLTAELENSGYNLKKLFANVASRNECLSYPQQESESL
ncbi:MAG: hypothetical protein SGJ18_02595 [Pseudomonadota bacterium]|nr:hypothetical protein [Pseudomonadota bacterium]